MTRSSFSAGRALPLLAQAPGPGFRLTDVTAAAGIDFRHNSGAFGAKYLPETMGPGCAFLDYDGDGWLDILLVNGMDWPGHKKRASTLRLYRNNRNGTFTDVTERAGLAVEMYGMGVAVGRLQQRRLSRSAGHRGRPEPPVSATRARAASST